MTLLVVCIGGPVLAGVLGGLLLGAGYAAWVLVDMWRVGSAGWGEIPAPVPASGWAVHRMPGRDGEASAGRGLIPTPVPTDEG